LTLCPEITEVTVVTDCCVGNMLSDNIMLYWKQKENTWPKLAAVACGLLGVPATSMSSERSFSLGGCTLKDRRTMLSADSVWMTAVNGG